MLVVGTQIIDLTPTPAKEWAVAHFGTADKPILIAAVALVTLAVAAAAGVVARRHLWIGAAVFAALGAGSAGLALIRADAQLVNAMPSAVSGTVAMAVLACLARPVDRGSPVTDPVVTAAGTTRRALLISAVVVLLAAGVETTARRIVSRRISPADVVLPIARDVPPALPGGLELRGITPFHTGNREFYRVDTRLSLPTVDIDTWQLEIDGDVRRRVAFTFEDLAAMPLIERDITLTCVSNEVGGRYVGGARWLGVRLGDVLDQADVSRSSADQILSTDVAGMTISTPVSIALDGRDSMIAIGMNGEPLPREHGFPARLIVPGLYGFVGATKWITRMTLTTYAAQDAYWTKRGWATDAPIKPSARIDTPRAFETVRAGMVTVGGIAWAQNSDGVEAVEVSIDDGPWRSVTLGPSGGQDYWRQWYLKWPADPGRHTVAARVVASDGHKQSSKRATPFPDGSSGIQRLVVSVA
jgi:DMSO/TMAO reductase YedYZ molybdopterin-dependent catalytic subunit